MAMRTIGLVLFALFASLVAGMIGPAVSTSGWAADEIAACKRCDGDNHIECSRCDGEGVRRVKCSDCIGKGELDCPYCDGGGKVLCGSCRGEGKLADKYGKKSFSCAMCGGKKKLACPLCAKRKKTISCPTCKGRSRSIIEVQCNACGGLGGFVCPDSTATKACAFCKGTRRQSCTLCAGSKKLYSACADCRQYGVRHCTQQYCLSGSVWCSSCAGTGRASYVGKTKCTECKGDGGTKCDRCRGVGSTDCPPRSVTPCRRCEKGKGKIECRACSRQ